MDIHNTTLFQLETLTMHGPHNPHIKDVIQAVSEQTGIPTDRILSRTQGDPVMYAKHLVRWLLCRHYGFNAALLATQLEVKRSSLINSLRLIDSWRGSKAYAYVSKDLNTLCSTLKIAA